MSELLPAEDYPETGRPHLILSGELDVATAPQITEQGTAALLAEDTVTLVVDLREVTFMDSTALGALVELHNTASAAHKRVALRNIPPRVLRLLDITGLNGVFGADT